MKIYKFVQRKLSDEYTPEQIDPADEDVQLPGPEDEAAQVVADALFDATAEEDDPQQGGESTTIVSDNDIVEDLPVVVEQQLRLSTFETIIETAIDDIVEENDGVVNEDTIREELEPSLDKAVALGKIPRHFRDVTFPELIAKRMRHYENKRMMFLERLAHHLTDDVAQIESDEVIADEVVDQTPPNQAAPISEEVVSPDEIEIDDGVPQEAAAAMRQLASSAVNHRKSTVLVGKRIAAPMLRKTLREMKHCIPKRFKKYI